MQSSMSKHAHCTTEHTQSYQRAMLLTAFNKHSPPHTQIILNPNFHHGKTELVAGTDAATQPIWAQYWRHFSQTPLTFNTRSVKAEVKPDPPPSAGPDHSSGGPSPPPRSPCGVLSSRSAPRPSRWGRSSGTPRRSARRSAARPGPLGGTRPHGALPAGHGRSAKPAERRHAQPQIHTEPPPLLPRPSSCARPSPPLPSLTAESARQRSHFLPSSPSDAILTDPSHLRPRLYRLLLLTAILARLSAAGWRRQGISRETSLDPLSRLPAGRRDGGSLPRGRSSPQSPASKGLFFPAVPGSEAPAPPGPCLFIQGSCRALARTQIRQAASSSPHRQGAPHRAAPLRAPTSSSVRALFAVGPCLSSFHPIDSHFHSRKVTEDLHLAQLLSSSPQGLKWGTGVNRQQLPAQCYPRHCPLYLRPASALQPASLCGKNVWVLSERKECSSGCDYSSIRVRICGRVVKWIMSLSESPGYSLKWAAVLWNWGCVCK